MENILINETPIRTSKNFKINNIEIKDVNIPSKVEKFKNYTIEGIDSNLEIKDKTLIQEKLTYGLGEVLEKNSIDNKNNELYFNVIGKKNNEVKVNYEIDKENINLIENINIVANEDTNSKFIFGYKTKNEDIEGFHNGTIKVKAEKNSYVKIIILNLVNEKTNQFMSVENVIKENAKVEYVIIDIGGKSSITNYYSNVIGDEAKNNIDTIYLGRNKQLLDFNYIGELRGKKTDININVQGALNDNAKKNFKGTIDFKQGCKKSTGDENEECMLLSDTAKAISLPMLLCTEEDVEGNHSSSAGKIGTQELFYILSRGISFKDARRLLVKAKFNKVLEKIEDEELKKEIIKEIDSRLD